MGLLGALIVALVLLFPVPARAQSVKPADVIGTWVRTTNDTLVMRPDGLLHWGQTPPVPYHLRVDTLVIQNGPVATIAIKDKTLRLVYLDRSLPIPPLELIYKRIDTPKPKP